ncbi:MAG TPA: 4a-hydroxytetrahydrobiopterin dehydratase [Candidatus Obscuribacterales bacterium]
MALWQKQCGPCRGDVPPLTPSQYEPLLHELSGWQVADGPKLVKMVKLDNFAQSLALANKIGALAEEQGHHPDLLVRWGSLRIEIWTHAIDGLSENDFILAAKIDQVLVGA